MKLNYEKEIASKLLELRLQIEIWPSKSKYDSFDYQHLHCG